MSKQTKNTKDIKKNNNELIRQKALQEKETCELKKAERPEIQGVFENDALVSLTLNGKEITPQSATLNEAKTISDELKRLTGLSNIDEALTFLLQTASSLRAPTLKNKFHQLISFLKEMKPNDAIEARLLSQFLVLDDNANNLMFNAKEADMLNHGDYFYRNSMKARNLSLQAIQTLMKYKSKGTQQINIVHMHDNSKAIMAQEIGGGGKS